MPIASYKLNNGTLTIGAPAVALSCQLTQAQVNPSENVETEERVPVLCGEQLPPSDTVTRTYRLAGTVVQDLAAGGVVDYTWVHAGEEVPFLFTPDQAQARVVSGTVRVAPLSIGGEVPTRPRSSFDWAIIGDPVFGPAA